MTGSKIISIFKSSPLLVTFGVAAVVVFGLSFAQYARRGGFWAPAVEARVFTNDLRNHPTGFDANGQRPFVFQGEVFSDASRLQESAALALAGMLVATNRAMENRPVQSVENLLVEMRSLQLVPPGVEYVADQKCLTSSFANYYLRYRQSPLGVEVVSECKTQLCGPTLLVRLPDDEFSPGQLTYYTAPRAGSVPVPAAFSPATDVINAGWRPESFRAQAPQPEVGKQ